MNKVGIVGIGVMGMAILEKFIEENVQVDVCDVNPEAIEKADKHGAEIVDNLENLPEEVKIILFVLPGPDQVKAVFSGLIDNCSSKHVLVDLSTVDPATSKENQMKAAENGVGYLDAPILGRPHKCGNWTLPVGGHIENYTEVEDVLSVIADKVLDMGEPGNGNALKLANNLMFGVINTVTSEIMALTEELGMDPGLFYDTVANSGAATVSNLFVELGPKIVNRDFSAKFTVEHLHKDMRLGIEMARDAGMPLMVADVCQKMNEIALAKGLNKEDSSSVVKVYENFTEKLNAEAGNCS